MNMLIMGSFFVVALLAFLAALWLAYTENQEMMAKTAMPSSSVPTTSAPTAPISITAEKNNQEKSAVAPTAQLAVKEPFQPVVSSSQLYEMALELRALRVQANEINERLLSLATLVENLQETSSSRLAIREELAV